MVVVAGVGVRLLLLAAELALPADCHQDGLLAGPERGHQPRHRAGLQRTTVRTDTTYRLFSYHVLHSFTFIVSETSHFPLPIQSLQSRGDGSVAAGAARDAAPEQGGDGADGEAAPQDPGPDPRQPPGG